MPKQQDLLRILVMDDNPSIHEDFKKILLQPKKGKKLKKLNRLVLGEGVRDDALHLPLFQIDSASQGQEGVERIQKALADNQPYALAFIDMNMPPGWDGMQTMKHIWDLDKDIQIVICTAKEDFTWEDTLPYFGISDNFLILKKPFDSIAVQQIAYALTKKWQLKKTMQHHTDLLKKTVQERTHALRDSMQKMEHQAMHDALTSLPNRVYLMEKLHQIIAYASSTHTRFALIYIDLDRFKLVNDSYGHEEGDKLLQTLANRLSAMTRTEDFIVRLSGDEFILVSIFKELTNNEDIIPIATRILNTIAMNMTIKQRTISMTGSVGVSIFPEDGRNVEELLQHADLAMYRAKTLGGNQFCFYTKTLQEQGVFVLEREVDLREAIERQQFYLEYQPQYDVKNKKLMAVEALVRWRHPREGILLPVDFILLAEQTNLIVPIGEWVLKTACAQNKAWQDQGLPHFMMAVNVTTNELMQAEFVDYVMSVLQETGLKTKYLEIEVTENVIISNINVVNTLNKLKKNGIRISLDDFGTGHSGFNYLRSLPIDCLKIDRSFIKSIEENPSDQAIIRAIIVMARSLNLDVIAEGVETIEQLNFLEDEDCQKIQGYYFSKPVGAEELAKLIPYNPSRDP